MVAAPGGVSLSVQEWNDTGGLPVLMIHGFSQARPSWAKQYPDQSSLVAQRMITFDLSGLGLSKKLAAHELS